MSLKNINASPRFTKHLVASRAFASSPLVVVDIGARGGFEPHWSTYGDQVKLIGFEADPIECERLNRQDSSSGNCFYPVALHHDKQKRPFYVTAYPSSSGFYQPDMEFWQRFIYEDYLNVEKTIEIDTVDFDSFAGENGIESVDFMKLDTEGTELEILKGALGFLRKSVIGLSIEVEFLPVHKGQPVFSDVDSFLRQIGFNLFDLYMYRDPRKVLPVSMKPIRGDYGQIIWGQALYLRDGVKEINVTSSLEDGWDDIRIMKLASLMEMFRLPDCSIELLQVARQKGLIKEKDVDHLIDLLVPAVGGKIVSYNNYLENLRIIESRGYTNNIKRAIQTSRKFVPLPVRRTAGSLLLKFRNLLDEIIK